MSTTTTYSPLQKRIRRTGLVGRAVCTFLLLAGTLVVAAWLFAIHGAGQWSIEHLAKTPEQTAFYQRLAAEGGYRAVVTAIVVLGGVLVLSFPLTILTSNFQIEFDKVHFLIFFQNNVFYS